MTREKERKREKGIDITTVGVKETEQALHDAGFPGALCQPSGL